MPKEEFVITNKERFPIDFGDDTIGCPYYKWQHAATLTKGGREFILAVGDKNTDILVLETTGGILEPVTDKEIYLNITLFVNDKELLYSDRLFLLPQGLSK